MGAALSPPSRSGDGRSPQGRPPLLLQARAEGMIVWEGSAAAPQAEQARGGPRAAPQTGGAERRDRAAARPSQNNVKDGNSVHGHLNSALLTPENFSLAPTLHSAPGNVSGHEAIYERGSILLYLFVLLFWRGGSAEQPIGGVPSALEILIKVERVRFSTNSTNGYPPIRIRRFRRIE